MGVWRIGAGICRDTGTGEHVDRMADLDIDAYVAGLAHHPEERNERARRAVFIAQRCQAYVARASFGRSHRQRIPPHGRIIARATVE